MNEPFKLNYYEMDADKEKDHLRNITEIFLLNTFPERSYFRNNAARYIIRELLVNLGNWGSHLINRVTGLVMIYFD